VASGQKRGPKKIIRSNRGIRCSNRGTLSRRRRVPERGRTHARARSSVCLPPKTYEAVGTTPWAKGIYPTSRGRRRPAPPGAQGRQKRPIKRPFGINVKINSHRAYHAPGPISLLITEWNYKVTFKGE